MPEAGVSDIPETGNSPVPVMESVSLQSGTQIINANNDEPGDDQSTVAIPGEEYGSMTTAETITEKTLKQASTGPVGNLAISGRVLNKDGSPVEGVIIVLRAFYLYDSEKDRRIYAAFKSRKAISDMDGTYAFKRLPGGEYRVSTEATDRYSSATFMARAGTDFADLVITEVYNLHIRGQVTTPDYEALSGVIVTPLVPGATKVTTDRDGEYTFDVMLQETVSNLKVRLSRQDYKEEEVVLNNIQQGEGNEYELNVVMQEAVDRALATVNGRITDTRGKAIVGQHLGLSSASTRENYRVTTDAAGRFAVDNVVPGEDYTLTINAKDPYTDYFQRGIKVPRTGLKLNIELPEQDTGILGGQMLNVYGTPVPDFMMSLQTKKTSFYNQRVIGDDGGNFRVEKVPAGELRLRTKSSPYYTIEGIQLAPEAEQQVAVVLDFGEDEIRGRVLNEQGYPVAVPNISLTWSHQQYGIRSTSRRTTAADEQGNFHFRQLGPGTHRLVINAAGYKPVTLNHNVSIQGTDLEVKLQPK